MRNAHQRNTDNLSDKQLDGLHRRNEHLHYTVGFFLQHSTQHLTGENDDDKIYEKTAHHADDFIHLSDIFAFHTIVANLNSGHLHFGEFLQILKPLRFYVQGILQDAIKENLVHLALQLPLQSRRQIVAIIEIALETLAVV